MGCVLGRCVWVSVLGHLALVLVLVFGSVFRPERERRERWARVSLVSAGGIEAALFGGGGEEAPRVDRVEVEEPRERVEVEERRVVPPRSVSLSEVVSVEPERRPERRPEPERKPERKRKPEVRINFERVEGVVDLGGVGRRDAAVAARLEGERRQREVGRVLDSLEGSLSGREEVGGGLVGGVGLGDYRLWVRRAYDRAWVAPGAGGVGSEGVTRVRVVVGLDGVVVSASVVGGVGSESVLGALGRVKVIGRRPPAGSSLEERTFFINFSLRDGRVGG